MVDADRRTAEHWPGMAVDAAALVREHTDATDFGGSEPGDGTEGAIIHEAIEGAVVGYQRRLIEHDRDAPEHRKVELELGVAVDRISDELAVDDAPLARVGPVARVETLLDQID